jgi:hypothetical protein
MKKLPKDKGYYLTKTIEDKWGVTWWDGIKWWDDPNQDGKLSFELKQEWIKDWYFLPVECGKLESELELLKAQDEECKHEFITREYMSQPYGTCLVCGRTIIK